MTPFPDPSARPFAGPARTRRPDFAFMRGRLSRLVAMGFGAGLSPVAPGTAGTLWGWVVFLLLDPWLGAWNAGAGWLLVVTGAFLLGMWATVRTGRDLGVGDHGAIVWDEVVAIWLVLAVLPRDFGTQLAGFLVFRVLDIVKPPPIRNIERATGGGFGVMVDDLAAGFITLLLLAWWQG